MYMKISKVQSKIECLFCTFFLYSAIIPKENENIRFMKEFFPNNAVEYLTFITATGESDVYAVYFDENVWLTQKMMGLLYSVETHTINYHLKKIFVDGELDENSVIRKFRITASDGNLEQFLQKIILKSSYKEL